MLNTEIESWRNWKWYYITDQKFEIHQTSYYRSPFHDWLIILNREFRNMAKIEYSETKLIAISLYDINLKSIINCLWLSNNANPFFIYGSMRKIINKRICSKSVPKLYYIMWRKLFYVHSVISTITMSLFDYEFTN